MLPDLKSGGSSISSKPVPGGTSLYWLADSMLIDHSVWENLIEGEQSRKKASLTGFLLLLPYTHRAVKHPQGKLTARSGVSTGKSWMGETRHWSALQAQNITHKDEKRLLLWELDQREHSWELPSCKWKNIPVEPEKDQANLYTAIRTFATSCPARLHSNFLKAFGSTHDWLCLIQQLAFLWTLKRSNSISVLHALCKARALFGIGRCLQWGIFTN